MAEKIGVLISEEKVDARIIRRYYWDDSRC